MLMKTLQPSKSIQKKEAHRNLSDSSENAISSLFSLKAYISEVQRVCGDFH